MGKEPPPEGDDGRSHPVAAADPTPLLRSADGRTRPLRPTPTGALRRRPRRRRVRGAGAAARAARLVGLSRRPGRPRRRRRRLPGHLPRAPRQGRLRPLGVVAGRLAVRGRPPGVGPPARPLGAPAPARRGTGAATARTADRPVVARGVRRPARRTRPPAGALPPAADVVLPR